MDWDARRIRVRSIAVEVWGGLDGGVEGEGVERIEGVEVEVGGVVLARRERVGVWGLRLGEGGLAFWCVVG